MLKMPTTCGYVVEHETNEFSKIRPSQKIWKADLHTTNYEEAKKKACEMKEQGFNVRMMECIY